MKRGLLGGAFNPVHNGHLAVAAHALQALGLQEVMFLPAGNPPHKSDLLPFEVRLNLLEEALRQHPRMHASDLDKDTGDTNYTFNLLQRVQEQYPDDELYFLIGDDNVTELAGWYRFPEVLELAQFVVFTRGTRHEWDSLPYVGHLLFVHMEPVPISSTRVRERLERGEDVSHLVPPAVAAWYAGHE